MNDRMDLTSTSSRGVVWKTKLPSLPSQIALLVNVMLGILARSTIGWMASAGTVIDGPMTATTLSSEMRRLARGTDLVSSTSSSYTTNSTCRPAMPPSALIRCWASSRACFCGSPTNAKRPEMPRIAPILIGSDPPEAEPFPESESSPHGGEYDGHGGRCEDRGKATGHDWLHCSTGTATGPGQAPGSIKQQTFTGQPFSSDYLFRSAD